MTDQLPADHIPKPTPGTFAEAARGVELLVNRLIRSATHVAKQHSKCPLELAQLYDYIRQHAHSGDRPSVIVSLGEQHEGCVPRELLLSQVRGTPDCPPEAAEPITRWMVGAAQNKPFFFAGYQAETLAENEIRLTRDPTAEHADLTFRWGRHAEETWQERTGQVFA